MDTEQRPSLRLEIVEKMSALAAAGLGLVAALAWNDAMQTLFGVLFGQASTLIAKFVYAIVITVSVVLLTMYLSRLANRIKSL